MNLLNVSFLGIERKEKLEGGGSTSCGKVGGFNNPERREGQRNKRMSLWTKRKPREVS